MQKKVATLVGMQPYIIECGDLLKQVLRAN